MNAKGTLTLNETARVGVGLSSFWTEAFLTYEFDFLIAFTGESSRLLERDPRVRHVDDAPKASATAMGSQIGTMDIHGKPRLKAGKLREGRYS